MAFCGKTISNRLTFSFQVSTDLKVKYSQMTVYKVLFPEDKTKTFNFMGEGDIFLTKEDMLRICAAAADRIKAAKSPNDNKVGPVAKDTLAAGSKTQDAPSKPDATAKK